MNTYGDRGLVKLSDVIDLLQAAREEGPCDVRELIFRVYDLPRYPEVVCSTIEDMIEHRKKKVNDIAAGDIE